MVQTQRIGRSRQSVMLQGVQWSTYQALSQDLMREPGSRLIYDQGRLEIMVPLPPHERDKSRLGRIVEIATEELETEILSLGSTTWSREDLQRGLEPNECFYIQYEPQVRGKDRIDLAQDPPPDLAIEVDNASSSLNRLAIYAALGVPEVWRFDGESLVIYCLEGDRHESVARSRALPPLAQEDILTWMVNSYSQGETTWARAVRQWIRAQRLGDQQDGGNV